MWSVFQEKKKFIIKIKFLLKQQECGGVASCVYWYWGVNATVSLLSLKVKTSATLVA